MITPTEDLSTYSYCGPVREVHLLHLVLLRQLVPGTVIFYCVDSYPPTAPAPTAGCRPADQHRFKVPGVDGSELRFFATADLGDPVSHDWTAIPEMQRTCGLAPGTGVQMDVGLGLTIGDLGYNLDIPPRGDNLITGLSEGMGASFPWMVAPGNHEADCNYTYANYIGRFAAQNLTRASHGPNSLSSRWYSFDLGPVHFSVIDTDAYGFDEVAYILSEQYSWLEADLAAVDRTSTPFLVLMGHRPMYCTSITAARSSHLGWPKSPDNLAPGSPPPPRYGDGFRSCGVDPPLWGGVSDPVTTCGVADLLRNGMLPTANQTGRWYGLEPLMQKYSVDVYLTGHEHNYERTWPIMNGSFVKSYSSPGRPVHVVTGSAGAYSKDEFGPAAGFDAFRSTEWSFSDIYANQTAMVFRQRLATNGSVIDSFVLTK
eukprot:TRINITY_DN14926_c0_g1_i2.p1 TRINITY_DN14926_c0_g1~~TRINITY_DN14926_c0_g1_i2.p1  ORF type:complete len:428 (-),score=55.29 TRINITY_DN14926_c0_g1_i2:437-1720(-)